MVMRCPALQDPVSCDAHAQPTKPGEWTYSMYWTKF